MDIPSYREIDEFAVLGYKYATSEGGVPSFPTEMALLAFNAGISNANIRTGTRCAAIGASSTKRFIQGAEGRADKELALLAGQL